MPSSGSHIPVVAVTELCAVTAYRGVVVCSAGSRSSWHPHALGPRAEVQGDSADFYIELATAGSAADRFVRDPLGRAARCISVDGSILVVGSLHPSLARSFKRSDPEFRAFQRFTKVAPSVLRVLREGAATRLIQQAAIHGLVNLNAQIIDAVEAMIGGGQQSRHVLEIQKGCFQIAATLQAAKVFAVDWVPATSSARLNAIHPSILVHTRTWEQALANRGIKIDVENCYREIRIESGIFAALVSNMLSNAWKYCKEGTALTISFFTKESSFVFDFSMMSRLIEPTEVSSITRYGVRGRHTTGSGAGIGLAFISEVLRAYRGELVIVPGVANNDSLYARNSFQLQFPLSMISEDGTSARSGAPMRPR